DATRVPQQPWRLQLGEVTDRAQVPVEVSLRDRLVQRWLQLHDRLPARRRVQLPEQLRGSAAEQIDQTGIELCAAAFTGHRDRGVGAARTAEDLDHVGQVDEPRADDTLLAAQPEGPFAIPPLVGLTESNPDVLSE